MALAVTLAGTFYDCIAYNIVFAYRDAAHFYPPVYDLVWQEWAAGRVPLWNPYLNCGQPLLGMGTAGVFYPPQIIATAICGSAMAVNVYGIFHLALAAWGSYLLARKRGCSRMAATGAGLGYGFSGSLFFQVYNPIFAAGGAWLVWSVLSGHEVLRGRRKIWLVGLSISLAAAVYAGDPQSAYHAGVVLGVLCLVSGSGVLKKLVLLASAAGLAALLCLVQIVATFDFISETSRGMDMAPQSIWQIPGFLARGIATDVSSHWYDIIIGQAPPIARHYRNCYSFAVPPWRVIEMTWPGFAGPVWSRWTYIAGIETSYMWVASLYAGAMIIVAAGAAVVLRGRDRVVVGWKLLCLFALWASFGGYAGMGVFRNLWCLLSGEYESLGFQYGDEVGSAYWLVTTVAPGYSGFRYPAKWLTVFALATAQLGGSGFDLLGSRTRSSKLARRMMTMLAWLSVGLLVGIVAAGVLTSGRVFSPASPYGRALLGVVSGFVQVVLVLGCWFWLTRSRRLFGGLIVLLIAFDLIAANRRDIVVGRHDRLVGGANYLLDLDQQRLPQLRAASGQLRVKVADLDRSLVTCRQPDKYLAYLGAAMATNTPWLFHSGVVGERGTAVMADFDMLTWQSATGEGVVGPRRVYDFCGVEYFIIGNDDAVVERSRALSVDWSELQKLGQAVSSAPAGEPMPAKAVTLPGDSTGEAYAFVVRNESALPRVRIVRDAVVVPSVSKTDWGHLTEMLKRISFPNKVLPDLRRCVVIEQPGDGRPSDFASAGEKDAAANDDCRIVVEDPQRVVVEATLKRPAYVVFADTFVKGWRLTVDSNGEPAKSVPILRANRIHRACRLPAGLHILTFTYLPSSFFWSGAITAIAWVLTAATVLFGRSPNVRSLEAAAQP